MQEEIKRGWVEYDEGGWISVVEVVTRTVVGYDSEEDALRSLLGAKAYEDEMEVYDHSPLWGSRPREIEYRVMYGGAPEDHYEAFKTESDAEDYALDIAEDIADRNGDDDVSIYGGPRAPEGWGACPRDSDGLGYPYIRIHMVR